MQALSNDAIPSTMGRRRGSVLQKASHGQREPNPRAQPAADRCG
jgi:hypothetical protein